MSLNHIEVAQGLLLTLVLLMPLTYFHQHLPKLKYLYGYLIPHSCSNIIRTYNQEGIIKYFKKLKKTKKNLYLSRFFLVSFLCYYIVTCLSIRISDKSLKVIRNILINKYSKVHLYSLIKQSQRLSYLTFTIQVRYSHD